MSYRQPSGCHVFVLMPDFHRKKNRLPDFDYKGRHSYFLTLLTFQKQLHFKDSEKTNFVLELLRAEAKTFNFTIHTYCFMPDHVHLLLMGNENSDLIKFMKLFKQKSGFHFKQRFGRRLWHKSYHDHVLRDWGSGERILNYILLNPVKAGLVADHRDYPFLGSEVVDLRTAT